MSARGRLVDAASVTRKNTNEEFETAVRVHGCAPFSNQVAGHKRGLANTGVLQHPDGTILKQLQPSPRGPREKLFYTQVYAEDCTDTRLLDLQKHLPRFYGTWTSQKSSQEVYLKLEDVTRGFVRPCIMDVKIGRQSYDPFASQEKREQQIRKFPLMEDIGFLLLGMRVYQISSESYITHDQFYGRSLGTDTVKNGLAQFFNNGKEIRKDAITQIISEIRSILRWFESQTQLHFYCSSLLLVYEGSPHRASGRTETGGEPDRTYSQPYCTDRLHDIWSDGNIRGTYGTCVEADDEPGLKHQEKFGLEPAVVVKMIDFAHVFPSDSPDESYMYGLRNLLSNFQQILKDSHQ